MKLTLTELRSRLSDLVIYRRAAEESAVLSCLRALLMLDEEIDLPQDALAHECRPLYAAFLEALYREGGDLGLYLADLLETDGNFYVRAVTAGKELPEEMQACFARELEFFSALSALTCEELLTMLCLPRNLPRYRTAPQDFTVSIPAHLASAHRHGYGMYARHAMFRVVGKGEIVPVLSPDPVTLEGLVGYESEREEVIRNTRALLCGLPAANVLLSGDAGTGKSATVKACVNRFFADGLRLIEIRKDQLALLPEIMGQLVGNPLKFILFCDDLSFSSDDDGYAALKAVLEGSATARVPNAVIYATSNRRHLVRESFSSREGDDVHRRDTMEEMLSLSARFGLTVTFSRPAKSLYLEIVRTLATEKGICLPTEELDRLAEAFALAKGGRSARTAAQFVDKLLADVAE